jgi:hypothetical protein
MAHLVVHEDAAGEVVDYGVYCSDHCAQGDFAYAGWNGCHDWTPPAWCEGCGKPLDDEARDAS